MLTIIHLACLTAVWCLIAIKFKDIEPLPVCFARLLIAGAWLSYAALFIR